ncbi:glycosyltransferase family 4 protein [Flavobacterium sp. K77]|uniref:Glycosyltransferase family 4 protein n=1 Tax=Flavobacterium turcicum TaxID=2764718 RepID=A0ABR7JIA5_9FLAO|nr:MULTISPECIES: glycosyltransferase family 4 protein [Flavobacterium]MBC5864224.1 glycosyltransferase family 4 protein [Flavobacterium turcicum]MCF6142085.1 glycosyltransferase family 4 protein [Flavobacterium sp. K77]NHL03132.1 glycosyltransferase family 4 protein [Flavobacterium turcicum]
MKLLYITNGINGSGGLERVLSVKASYLAEVYNYDVTILCLNDGHEDPFYRFSDKIKMLSITVAGNPFQYIMSYKNGIQKIIKTIEPNVVSVCDDGLKGFFIPKIIGYKTPIIYERHASIELDRTNGLANTMKRKLMQKLAADFTAFIVLTKSNLNEWTSNNLICIPNPLTFYPATSSTLNTNSVIFVGSQSHNKGVDLLLLAWQEVTKKFPDWKLSFYGKGHHDHKYEKLATKLEIEQTVFFNGPVQNIEKKYLESALMVLPSRSEGFGMVLIEAMACGVPCVSFDCPSGPRDIIQDAVDGYLVPAEEVAALALKMMDLMADEEKRILFGRRAKLNVQRFLPASVVSQWDLLFKKLIS